MTEMPTRRRTSENDAEKMLRLCADDPMWADHAEVSKSLLVHAADELAALREQLARFTPLRAKGVVDADDNLDCWDTNPYEICTRHVAALNEKDPAAMWRVVDLFARDEGPNE